MHERLRDRLLGFWGRLGARHPRPTLAICLLVAAGCVVLTIFGLKFRADRSELIDPKLTWNHQYLEYKKHFPRWGDVVVVLQGEPGDQAVDLLARRIAQTIGVDARVASADAGFDSAEAGPKLFMTAPRELFEQTLQQLGEARELAAAGNANAAMSRLLQGLAADDREAASGSGAGASGHAEHPDPLDQLEQFLEPYLAGIEGGPSDFSFSDPTQSRWQPSVSKMGSGRLRFILVYFASDTAVVDDLSTRLKWLRQEVGRLVAASDRPRTEWGVTGIPAIESDETEQSIHDATIASILAAVLIVALMLIAFRGWVVPLLAIGSLLIGMAWSFGWLILTVGHLQVLSVVFTSILLGVGIDYALLFISRLELVRDRQGDLDQATARVFRSVGPGVITGAVTAAAAFASTSLTSFTGMAEMGIIAGGGLLLCLVSVLTVFPAALSLLPDWKKVVRHRPGGETAHFAGGRLNCFDQRPLTTLMLSGLFVVVLLWFARGVRYDSDILELQAPNMESVVWERRVVEDDSRSVWAAVVLTTPEETPAAVQRLRQLHEVSEVGGMGMLFPGDLAERQAAVAVARTKPVSLPSVEPGMQPLITQLAAVRAGMMFRGASAKGPVKERLDAIGRRLDQVVSTAGSLDDKTQAARWEGINNAFLTVREQLASYVEGALSDRPVGPEDLPRMLREQWIGTDGSWLLQAYPVIDPDGRSVLDQARLGPFVAAVRSAAPEAIGPPIQIYESGRIIVRAYIQAACYAVAVILLLLMLDFRSLADAMCSMVPVTVGFIGVFGLLGAADMPLNFANLIVMPLVFGLGMDASVNMVHRWRQEPHGRPAGLSGGTGRGITLAMLSTMIGFGALLISQHRGIRSLGFVMLAGMGVTLLACYTMLPAILRLRTRPDSVQRDSDDESSAWVVEPRPDRTSDREPAETR